MVDIDVVVFLYAIGIPIVLCILIVSIIWITRGNIPFKYYPHIVYDMDISGRRQPSYDDWIYTWAMEHKGLDVQSQFAIVKQDWDAQARKYLMRCILWRTYKQNVYMQMRNEICSTDYNAFVFNFFRNQTRYRQSNYQRFAYQVANTEYCESMTVFEMKALVGDIARTVGSLEYMRSFSESHQSMEYRFDKTAFRPNSVHKVLQNEKCRTVNIEQDVAVKHCSEDVVYADKNPFGPMVPLHPEYLIRDTLDYMKSHRYFSADEYIRQCDRFAKQRIPGCYIIYNCDTGKFYVGQAIDLMRRVKEHLNGKQSGGEQLDYDIAVLHHDVFIKHIPQLKSGYMDLNEMERCLIAAYDCVTPNGYNLTRGNGVKVL